MLGRTLLFFAGSAMVVALRIGANYAVFNLAHSVLLKSLPYEPFPLSPGGKDRTRVMAAEGSKASGWPMVSRRNHQQYDPTLALSFHRRVFSDTTSLEPGTWQSEPPHCHSKSLRRSPFLDRPGAAVDQRRSLYHDVVEKLIFSARFRCRRGGR